MFHFPVCVCLFLSRENYLNATRKFLQSSIKSEYIVYISMIITLKIWCLNILNLRQIILVSWERCNKKQWIYQGQLILLQEPFPYYNKMYIFSGKRHNTVYHVKFHYLIVIFMFPQTSKLKSHYLKVMLIYFFYFPMRQCNKPLKILSLH